MKQFEALAWSLDEHLIFWHGVEWGTVSLDPGTLEAFFEHLCERDMIGRLLCTRTSFYDFYNKNFHACEKENPLSSSSWACVRRPQHPREGKTALIPEFLAFDLREDALKRQIVFVFPIGVLHIDPERAQHPQRSPFCSFLALKK